ncbi:MAG: nucleotidyltransferase domain-containing protein [Nitrospirota bacterium]
MSRFGEYIEGWKEKEKLLESRLSSCRDKVWELLPVVAEKLKSLGAKKVIIFGSLIEGDFKIDSDIDIAVEGLPESKYIEAIIETEKILTTADIDFDLVLYERAYPWIKEKVNRGKIL